MKTLRLTLTDLELGPLGDTHGITGEAWARYTREVRTTDGKTVVLAESRKRLPATGIVEWSVLPNDDPTVHPDDQGFGIEVGYDLYLVKAAPPGRNTLNPDRVHVTGGKTITVTSADVDPVAYASKAPAVPADPLVSYATEASVSLAVAGRAPLPTAAKNPLTGWFHVDGYGAPTNNTGNAAPAIQAAIDAAQLAGGGVVYLPEQYRITTGLLLPSNVELRGNNSGGQPGASGAYSRIVYAGPAGGTVIAPKVRTGDTVNVGIKGLRIDGGGLAAIIVEMYRVSYSRLQDLSILGGQAGAVGVLFDANVSGQCYFNVSDNVKVDGLTTGVRFTRGANANRWQGGKIGNGDTGMEFLSLSAGNLVQATDFETAAVKHVYIDAASNVFVGLHMEVAPIGYDITANGQGTRRNGTTFATNVTTWVQSAATVAGGIDETDSSTYLMQVGTTKTTSKSLSTTTQVNVDPITLSGTASALYYLFRNVSTTGTRQFAIYKGDGTGTPALLIDAGKGQFSLGSVGLGTTTPGQGGVLAIPNRSVAPAGTVAGGGVLFVEAGALKYLGSSGTVTTIAPA